MDHFTPSVFGFTLAVRIEEPGGLTHASVTPTK